MLSMAKALADRYICFMEKINVIWFRRDLRLHDQSALYHALQHPCPALPLFIFDPAILSELPPTDRRVQFIHSELEAMRQRLRELGSDMLVMYGTPLHCFTELSQVFDVQHVFTNHDYEPYALQRDTMVADYLQSRGIRFSTFKDQVIFEKKDIVKDDGLPYTVYTPYSKKWKLACTPAHLASYPCEQGYANFYRGEQSFSWPSLASMGFNTTKTDIPSREFPADTIRQYHQTRDIPSVYGTSKLSVHLRFGTISIRELTRFAVQHNEKYLNELIWREFYQSILWHFPHVVHASFKPAYDLIQWQNDDIKFNAWCNGQTGYPIVDAGMRELLETGWMHNRVRMITASFLTKHLLIDWRLGEAWFAKHLLDFDLASNNGGWQWAAGSGVDAAPYFRIFNPYLQTAKFDPGEIYIRKWIPELDSPQYPKPIVVHEEARQRCLSAYKIALGNPTKE